MTAGAHIDADLPGYLLGALEGEDRARVAEHLASCERCAAERAADAEALTALAASVDDVSPDAAVRRSLLAGVGRVGGATPRPRSLLPFRIDPGSSNPVLRWASIGMAAAFIFGLVGGVTGWALVLGDRLDQKTNDLNASRNTLETLVHSGKIATMDGAINATPVHAAVGIPASGTGAVVVVSDLPAPSTGQGYHLWLFSNGTAQLAGVWSPDAHGDMIARLDQNLGAYDSMEVVLEPMGATAPAGTPVVSATLP